MLLKMIFSLTDTQTIGMIRIESGLDTATFLKYR